MKEQQDRGKASVEDKATGATEADAGVQLRALDGVPLVADTVQLKAGRRALLERPVMPVQLRQVNGLRALAEGAVQMQQSETVDAGGVSAGLGGQVGAQGQTKYRKVKDGGRVKTVEVETGRVVRDVPVSEPGDPLYKEERKDGQVRVVDAQTGEVMRENAASRSQDELQGRYREERKDGVVRVVDTQTGETMREHPAGQSQEALAQRYKERRNGDFIEVVDASTGEVVRRTQTEAGRQRALKERYKEERSGGHVTVTDTQTGEVVRRNEGSSGFFSGVRRGFESVVSRGKEALDGAKESDLAGALSGDPGEGLVQQKADVGGAVQEARAAAVRQHAASGVRGSGGALPHLEAIQKSFGQHDVTAVQAFVGGSAREATEAMGAEAYATGNKIAFGGSPSLHTAAHEAAHIVQQRAGVQLKGGVGQVGDVYERHADAVADLVVQGKSAEPLLSGFASGGHQEAVQFKDDMLAEGGVMAPAKQVDMAKLHAAQKAVQAVGFKVAMSPNREHGFMVNVTRDAITRTYPAEVFISQASIIASGKHHVMLDSLTEQKGPVLPAKPPLSREQIANDINAINNVGGGLVGVGYSLRKDAGYSAEHDDFIRDAKLGASSWRILEHGAHSLATVKGAPQSDYEKAAGDKRGSDAAIEGWHKDLRSQGIDPDKFHSE